MLVTSALSTFVGDGNGNNSPEIHLDPSVTSLTEMPVNTTTGTGNSDSIHDSLGAMEFVGNTLYTSTIECGPEVFDSFSDNQHCNRRHHRNKFFLSCSSNNRDGI